MLSGVTASRPVLIIALAIVVVTAFFIASYYIESPVFDKLDPILPEKPYTWQDNLGLSSYACENTHVPEGAGSYGLFKYEWIDATTMYISTYVTSTCNGPSVIEPKYKINADTITLMYKLNTENADKCTCPRKTGFTIGGFKPESKYPQYNIIMHEQPAVKN